MIVLLEKLGSLWSAPGEARMGNKLILIAANHLETWAPVENGVGPLSYYSCFPCPKKLQPTLPIKGQI